MKACSLSRMIVVLTTFLLLFGGVAGVYAEECDMPLTIRVRGLGVLPDVDSETISVAGGEADVDNSVGVEIDFVYFFQKNLAAELVLGVAQHNVEAKGTALGNVDLGDVWLIPPTLTVQYHFMPEAKIRPYVGAGVNYTIFFEENSGTVASDTGYDNAFGYALQAGVDIGITENFAFNIDLKKLYLDTEADVTIPGVGTAKVDVDIDPWLMGVGIAYRF